MSETNDIDPDKKLTLEAKEAIRSYLIKIFVPSTITLTIISGVVGYSIKDIAQKEAIETALSKVTDFTNQINAKILADSDTIHQERLDIDKFHDDEKEAAKAAKDYADQQARLIQGDYSKLAKQLLSDDAFKTSLANVNTSEFAKIEARLGAIEQFVDNAKRSGGGTPASGPASSSQCPAGSYAVGFSFLDEGGLAHGALYAGSILCRSFAPG